MRFFTSDLHFGHARINELSGRPFASVDEMNEALIVNWRNVVEEEDEVWVLGDLALGLFAETMGIITGRLPGKKFLVPGNHDRVHSINNKKYRDRFRGMYEGAGFTIADEQVLMRLDGIPVRLCHFPYVGDSHDKDRYWEHRPVDDGRTLIHGHVHEKWTSKFTDRGTLMVNVGVDAEAWRYTPVSQRELVNFMKSWNAVDPRGMND